MYEKPIIWIGSSKDDLLEFPEDVRKDVGYALHFAQNGEKHPGAKPFKGVDGGVFEVVVDFDSDTYRAVYAVKLGDTLYVLHCFKKKSKSGIKTPPNDIKVIKSRLKEAKELANGKR